MLKRATGSSGVHTEAVLGQVSARIAKEREKEQDPEYKRKRRREQYERSTTAASDYVGGGGALASSDVPKAPRVTQTCPGCNKGGFVRLKRHMASCCPELI